MIAIEDIRHFLEEDYAQAFSSKQPQQVLDQFVADGELRFHQLGQDKSGKGGQGKIIYVHTGSTIKALSKGQMPAWMMLGIVFWRLAKSHYDRSTIELMEVQGPLEGFVWAMIRWERWDSEGVVFENGYSVLKLNNVKGRWKINEGWTLDTPLQWDSRITGVSFDMSE